MCMCACVFMCERALKPVSPESENNLTWVFWFCDTMWYLQWPKYCLWCKQQGKGKQTVDKRARQKQTGRGTRKEDRGDVVDTLNVYLTAGLLRLNLFSPLRLCSSPCLLCPLSAPSGHTSWHHAAGSPPWEVQGRREERGHRWRERSQQQWQ